MRKKRQIQMPLLIADIDHTKAAELRRISRILDRYPIISRMVWQDLSVVPRSAIELAWTAGSGRFRRKRGVVDSSDLFGRCLFYCQRVSAPR